jgi:formyl-CoA transferase
MERPDLLGDPRFTKLVDRAAHGDVINGIVAEWTATLDAKAIEARCIACDVPVATAYTAADIFADPHMIERADLVTVDDPVIGPIRQQAPFPRRVGEPPAAPCGAPRLGEHTRAVLHDLLDLSDTELDRLATEGVI